MKTINLSPKHEDTIKFVTEKDVSAKKNYSTFKRIIAYFKNYKILLIIVLILIIIYAFCETVCTVLLTPMIDKYIIPLINNVNNSNYYFNGLLTLLIIFISLNICSVLSQYFQKYIMVYITQNVVSKLRNELFTKLGVLDTTIYNKYKNGEILSRITNDLDSLTNALDISIRQIISSCLFVIIALSIMIYISLELALICIISIPLIFICSSAINKMIRKYSLKQQESIGQVNGFLLEFISSIKDIKSNNLENVIQNKFEPLNNDLKNNTLKSQTLSSLIMLSVSSITNIFIVLTSILSAILAVFGKVTIGNISTFIKFSENFSKPFLNISQQIAIIQFGMSSAKRIFELLDEDEEITFKITNNINISYDSIKFNNVSFAYNSKKVLDNMNFEINKGQFVAIVGPTGAGKTTIANLLMHFYNIDCGEVLINNTNINDINVNELRKNINIILQDINLFNDTVYNNIVLGNEYITLNDVKCIAQRIQLKDEFEKFENSYDTIIKEDMSNISEGQKQLISIMRAIVSNPQILILDEATTNIDIVIEHKIYMAIKELFKDKICIVIAHKLSTIYNADKIIYVENGRFIEQGTHNELLQLKGKYYNMYKSYDLY